MRTIDYHSESNSLQIIRTALHCLYRVGIRERDRRDKRVSTIILLQCTKPRIDLYPATGVAIIYFPHADDEMRDLVSGS